MKSTFLFTLILGVSVFSTSVSGDSDLPIHSTDTDVLLVELADQQQVLENLLHIAEVIAGLQEKHPVLVDFLSGLKGSDRLIKTLDRFKKRHPPTTLIEREQALNTLVTIVDNLARLDDADPKVLKLLGNVEGGSSLGETLDLIFSASKQAKSWLLTKESILLVQRKGTNRAPEVILDILGEHVSLHPGQRITTPQGFVVLDEVVEANDARSRLKIVFRTQNGPLEFGYP